MEMRMYRLGKGLAAIGDGWFLHVLLGATIAYDRRDRTVWSTMPMTFGRKGHGFDYFDPTSIRGLMSAPGIMGVDWAANWCAPVRLYMPPMRTIQSFWRSSAAARAARSPRRS
jgi:hypothetical protein